MVSGKDSTSTRPDCDPLPHAPLRRARPFRIRSYRFQWPADLLTSWAFEMETLVLGWYVLVETNSVVMLTVFGALLYGGTLIAPIVGVWSDRIGHRTMLSRMRAMYALVAATVMVLAFTGTLHPTFVLVLAARHRRWCGRPTWGSAAR